MLYLPHRWPCSPALRLFLETDKAGAPSYAIDWYVAGRAPPVCDTGLSKVPARTSLVVVYKAVKGCLAKIWVGVDKTALSELKDCTEAMVKESDEYAAVCWFLCCPIVKRLL